MSPKDLAMKPATWEVGPSLYSQERQFSRCLADVLSMGGSSTTQTFHGDGQPKDSDSD